MKKEEQKVSGIIYLSEDVKNSIREQYKEEVAQNKIKLLYLPLDDYANEELEVLVKVPDRNTTTQFMRFISDNPKKAQELLLNQSLLTNKEQVMADDALFFACAGKIAELFPIREARIKNF